MDESNNQDSTQGVIKISARVLNIKMRATAHAWHPATDLVETQSHYIIKIEIAGMNEEDFAVSVQDNIVQVCGHRPLVNPDGAFHRLEVPYGDFNTVVELPHDIVQNKIEAFYQNGFLTIMLPKAKPVNIEIKGK